MTTKSTTRVLTVILVIIQYISISSALQCYKCTILPPSHFSNETERLCSQFDYSNKYIVDCPFSTICMKKSFEVELSGQPIIRELRDCASQKYKYQAYVHGKWQTQSSIEEPYTEGCEFVDDKGARSAKTKYCYCRGHLCNAASNLEETSYHVDTICVIFVYNALKLFYSLR
ncbi:uncharacterized protein CBL_12946 [Carabus blaptoides fortunei]